MNAKSMFAGQMQPRQHCHLACCTSFTNAWPQRSKGNLLSEDHEPRTSGMKRTFVPMLMAAAMMAIAASSAFAFPSRTDACINCHNDGSGSLIPSPDTLNVVMGDSGLISFDVTFLPEPDDNTVIALTDLTQAGLDAAIGPAGDNWSTDATMTKSDQFTYEGAHTLELQVGAAAIPGSYNLTWYLAGAGPKGKSGVFTVNVIDMVGAPTLSIAPATPGNAIVSWTPATGTHWVLQESLSLSLAAWTNSPSGTTNPIVVPVTVPAKFYRLHKP